MWQWGRRRRGGSFRVVPSDASSVTMVTKKGLEKLGNGNVPALEVYVGTMGQSHFIAYIRSHDFYLQLIPE